MPVQLVEFENPRHASNAEIVGVLERFLAQAKDGEITGLALAVSRHDDRCTTSFHFGPDAGHKLTAAVASLFHLVMDHATNCGD